MTKALGLIETIGLPAAIEAADAAVKAAQVTLMGCESAKGGGLTVVMISGDVGAVKAAVEAGQKAASRVGRVWAVRVIPRPHSDTAELLHPDCIKGLRQGGRKLQHKETEVSETVEILETQPEDLVPDSRQDYFTKDNSGNAIDKELCNLCQDPLCSRKKGEPKINCLHYGDKEAEIYEK